CWTTPSRAWLLNPGPLGLRNRSCGMTTLTRAVVLALFLLLIIQPITFAQKLDGFSVNGSQEQRRIEEQFRAVPQPATAREELRRLTSEAHIAGSPEDYATAVYVRDQMRSFGLQSDLKE